SQTWMRCTRFPHKCSGHPASDSACSWPYWSSRTRGGHPSAATIMSVAILSSPYARGHPRIDDEQNGEWRPPLRLLGRVEGGGHCTLIPPVPGGFHCGGPMPSHRAAYPLGHSPPSGRIAVWPTALREGVEGAAGGVE